MTVYQIDPLGDPRWFNLVESHPRTTVFHTRGWIEALLRTYGYRPVVFTTDKQDEQLKNGLLFCRVSSWLTGCRLVSLPFSDHCQPIVDDAADLMEILGSLESRVDRKECRYVELRPLAAFGADVESRSRVAGSDPYYLHSLDLRPSLDALFRNFHKSCVQRKLQRAEREGLKIEEGRSPKLLRHFYRLMIMTRRRHKIPPQPFSWFRNLIDCLGEQAVIRVAFKGSVPIASIFVLMHKKTVVYKYGCSDAAFHHLGGMLSLFWRTIQIAKQQSFEEFDFGRSEVGNSGLLAFKDHWGGARIRLRYYRYPPQPPQKKVIAEGDWRIGLAEQVFSRLPDFCLSFAGKLLYRHIG